MRPEAAETLGITASRLKGLGLVDRVVSEPIGGAHRDPGQMAVTLKRAVDNVRPMLEVKSRRVGGASYQVPVEVKPSSRTSFQLGGEILGRLFEPLGTAEHGGRRAP